MKDLAGGSGSGPESIGGVNGQASQDIPDFVNRILVMQKILPEGRSKLEVNLTDGEEDLFEPPIKTVVFSDFLKFRDKLIRGKFDFIDFFNEFSPYVKINKDRSSCFEIQTKDEGFLEYLILNLTRGRHTVFVSPQVLFPGTDYRTSGPWKNFLTRIEEEGASYYSAEKANYKYNGVFFDGEYYSRESFLIG